MADKTVGELIAAQSVTPPDLFVLEQNGTAKKLTGQILENWLVSFADGHGGIQSIVKKSTSGLVDTYRITLADTTTFDFMVTNGKSIKSISKESTSGLVDTYRITFNDSTSSTFTVTNGAKGDKGDNAYIWVKYASQNPTSSSVSIGDIPDNWMGVYFGTSATAPTSYSEYKWYQIKGKKGDTGAPAILTSSKVEYQVCDSGYIIPSGAWSTSVPVVPQGKYLWTRITNTFNSGSPVVSYSVSRMGMDGSGSVTSVSNISPDESGNVPLKATNIGAVPSIGGTMTGELNMSGRNITNLGDPVIDHHAATMAFVNQQVKNASPWNMLDNSNFANPVNQRGLESYTGNCFSIDRWRVNADTTLTVMDGFVRITGRWNFWQVVPVTLKAGKTYTAVAKCKASTDTRTLYFYLRDADGKSIANAQKPTISTDWGVYIFSVTLETDLVNGCIEFHQSDKNTEIGTDIMWVALYEGEYTVKNIPEYHPKGYGAEFLECQRYYQIRSTNNIAAVDIRPVMRLSSPTITSISGGYEYSADL